jgi:hypothetical protein
MRTKYEESERRNDEAHDRHPRVAGTAHGDGGREAATQPRGCADRGQCRGSVAAAANDRMISDGEN